MGKEKGKGKGKGEGELRGENWKESKCWLIYLGRVERWRVIREWIGA